MELKVLGSSSKGNCYLIQNKEECLILEAGVQFKEVKKALNFNVSKIVGICITHEHGDHAKFIKDYTNLGVPIVMSKGTADATIGKLATVIESGKSVTLGDFKVTAFDVEHDASEPVGYVISHKDIGNLLFLTDTYYCKYRFANINHMLVECNYSNKILDQHCENGFSVFLRNRIMKSHMELEQTKEFIKSNRSNSLKNVILIHLSDGNSDSKLFQKECEEVSGVATYVADKGVTANLDLIPF